MENLLEFTNETLSDHKNHILIESSIHEPSIFMSSADPTRFTFASAFAFVTSSRVGLRGGGGVGMGVSGMVFVGLVLGCIEAKFCK